MKTMKAYALGLLLLLSVDAQAGLSEIARNADGTVFTMDHYAAERFCASQGGVLPTARDFSIYAQGLGARGICPVEAGLRGCRPIDGSSYLRKDPDPFYYDFDGYQAPAGDLGTYWFWTSSILIRGANYAYSFNGERGEIAALYFSRTYDKVAVRCLLP